jgi:hypothetical protein
MAKTIPFETPFKPNEKVRATEDLPNVPKGMRGKVQVANGIRWKRYWVRFDNGVALGQIDHQKLVRAKDWDRWKAEASAPATAAVAAGEGAAAGAAAGAADAGGGAVVNGVTVPQKLLDRSAAAHARLGR